jgi:hypothetical protein
LLVEAAHHYNARPPWIYAPEGRGHAEAGWSAAFDKLAALVAG